MVGLLEDAQYVQGSVRLSPGDLLVLFTDGISEAMNLDDEEWGEDRLLQSIQISRGASADELLKHLSRLLPALPAPTPQHDDIDPGGAACL